jgi:hypothetical protein
VVLKRRDYALVMLDRHDIFVPRNNTGCFDLPIRLPIADLPDLGTSALIASRQFLQSLSYI